MKNWFFNYIGWIGMGFLQFNSLPAIWAALETGASMPLGTVGLTIAGLMCYNLRAIRDKDVLYITGNTIGLVGNGILFYLIVAS